jgi:hypothetical protein
MSVLLSRRDRELAEVGRFSPLPERVHLSGDGAVVYALRERFLRAAVAEARIRIECYFNNRAKKSF